MSLAEIIRHLGDVCRANGLPARYIGYGKALVLSEGRLQKWGATLPTGGEHLSPLPTDDDVIRYTFEVFNL